jgi:nucleoside-diphosphate-sugar epimerase
MSLLRVLVTGAAGGLGRRLVARLCRDGHEVRGMVLPADFAASVLDGTGYKVVSGDVTQVESIAGSCSGIDTVCHLAATVLSRDDSQFEQVNHEGTQNLLREAERAGVKHFVYISSASVTYRQLTPYAASKVAAENAVKAAGIPFTIVRPTLVYDRVGGHEFEIFRRVISKLPILPLPGGGRAVKRPIWAEDVVQGLSLIVKSEARGRTYNLSGATPISMRDLAVLVLEQAGRAPLMFPVPESWSRAVMQVMLRLGVAGNLSQATISGWVEDADLAPTLAQRELNFHPLGIREGFAQCFPNAQRFPKQSTV